MTEHTDDSRVVQIRKMPADLHKWLRQQSLDTGKSMERLIIEAVESAKTLNQGRS